MSRRLLQSAMSAPGRFPSIIKRKRIPKDQSIRYPTNGRVRRNLQRVRVDGHRNCCFPFAWLNPSSPPCKALHRELCCVAGSHAPTLRTFGFENPAKQSAPLRCFKGQCPHCPMASQLPFSSVSLQVWQSHVHSRITFGDSPATLYLRCLCLRHQKPGQPLAKIW